MTGRSSPCSASSAMRRSSSGSDDTTKKNPWIPWRSAIDWSSGCAKVTRCPPGRTSPYDSTGTGPPKRILSNRALVAQACSAVVMWGPITRLRPGLSEALPRAASTGCLRSREPSPTPVPRDGRVSVMRQPLAESLTSSGFGSLAVKHFTSRHLLTREVPGVPVLTTKIPVFAGILEPSDGLEPPTPSLPWRFWSGNRRTRAVICDLVCPCKPGITRVPEVYSRVRACSGWCTRLVPASCCLIAKQTTKPGILRRCAPGRRSPW